MKNRITVTVSGQEYTLVATEDKAYIEKLAAHVDAQMREISRGTKFSLVDASVLTAINIADQYFKEASSTENLRRQLKELLEESARTKLELSEARREIFRLQQRK